MRALLNVYAHQESSRLKSRAEEKRRIEAVFAEQLNQPLIALTLQALQQATDRWQSARPAAAVSQAQRRVLGLAHRPDGTDIVVLTAFFDRGARKP